MTINRKYSHFKTLGYINVKDIPKEKGIYIFKVKKNVDMEGFENNKFKYNKRIIYVGKVKIEKSGDLRSRLKNHLSDNSSNSSFRRSIGAIFKKSWNLKAFPSGKNPKNYNFIRISKNKESGKENEVKITNWMKNNLEYRFIVDNSDKLENIYIEKLKPTCNDDEFNPLRHRLFGKNYGPSLRTTCRVEANKKIK
tara:strand:+ start:55 stop:639 length:585 start_codon:yes stop_codon:yes gene_type:complete